MGELVLLAIASAFWPLLLAVAIVSLRASHPPRLLVSFLAGGLIATMSVGLAGVYALQGSSLTGSSKSTFDPTVEIVVGALALLAAAVLWHRLGALAETAPREEPVAAEPGKLERMLDRGAPLAFVAGIIGCILPGPLPLVALKDISEMDIGFAETFAVMLGFYLIMFAFIELPLIGYVAAPEWTAGATQRFNAWLSRNMRRAAIVALGAVGVYLLVKGVIAAVS